jgi:hypothetical protein
MSYVAASHTSKNKHQKQKSKTLILNCLKTGQKQENPGGCFSYSILRKDFRVQEEMRTGIWLREVCASVTGIGFELWEGLSIVWRGSY